MPDQLSVRTQFEWNSLSLRNPAGAQPAAMPAWVAWGEDGTFGEDETPDAAALQREYEPGDGGASEGEEEEEAWLRGVASDDEELSSSSQNPGWVQWCARGGRWRKSGRRASTGARSRRPRRSSWQQPWQPLWAKVRASGVCLMRAHPNWSRLGL